MHKAGGLLKTYLISQYRPRRIWAIDKVVKVVGVRQVQHLKDEDRCQRKYKNDDINGKGFVDQLAAQGRGIKALYQAEDGFGFGEVKALRGDKQHQRDKKQSEPDKFIVAKYQHHQAYTGDGHVKGSVGFIIPQDMIKEQEKENQHQINGFPRTGGV